jgi:hypothetical protein
MWFWIAQSGGFLAGTGDKDPEISYIWGGLDYSQIFPKELSIQKYLWVIDKGRIPGHSRQ